MMSALAFLIAPVVSSCSSEDTPEILQPVSEHILGRWEISAGYILENGKWENHDDPASPRVTYNFLDNDSILLCSTDARGWSVYSMTPYKVDNTRKVVMTGAMESKIELLSVDSLVMVSDFLHDPNTGETLAEPIHYKWGFKRIASDQRSLGETLIGKWKFTGTEEKKDGVWTGPADVPTPTECTNYFTANGLLIIDMVFQGESYKVNYDWKINNTDGDILMVEKEHVRNGRVEFDGNDRMWIYYTETSADGTTLELRDGGSRIK